MQVQRILKITFGVVPIAAGLDKFTNLLVDWSAYLNPGIKSALPFDAMIFMKIVGVSLPVSSCLLKRSPVLTW